MGRTHHATGLSFHPITRSSRLAIVLFILCCACVLILITPYRLHAETVTTATDSVATTKGAATPATPHALPFWEKVEHPTDETTVTPTVSGRATKGFLYLLGALLLGFTITKRYSQKRTVSSELEINVIARKAISPKHALLVVTVDGERMLLAQTAENLSLVTKLASDGFSTELAQFMDEEHQSDDPSQRQSYSRSAEPVALQKVGNQ